MDLEKLKAFLITRAPEEAFPPFSLLYLYPAREGTAEFQAFPARHDSTFFAILSIVDQIAEIAQPTDPNQFNPWITNDTASAAGDGYLLLENLAKGKKPPSEFGSHFAVLSGLVKSMDMLIEHYYRPQIASLQQKYSIADTRERTLQTRHDYLLKQSLSDPSALDVLYNEFYPNGIWNPDRKPIAPHAHEIARRRQQRNMREEFKAAIQSARENNSSHLRAVGISPCIDKERQTLENLNASIKITRGAMEAVSKIAIGLREIFDPAFAPTLASAKIYEFSARGLVPQVA